MLILRIMSFENAAVPLSLFADYGSLLSYTKSDFKHKLEELVSEEPILRTLK